MAHNIDNISHSFDIIYRKVKYTLTELLSSIKTFYWHQVIIIFDC